MLLKAQWFAVYNYDIINSFKRKDYDHLFLQHIEKMYIICHLILTLAKNCFLF